MEVIWGPYLKSFLNLKVLQIGPHRASPRWKKDSRVTRREKMRRRVCTGRFVLPLTFPEEWASLWARRNWDNGVPSGKSGSESWPEPPLPVTGAREQTLLGAQCSAIVSTTARRAGNAKYAASKMSSLRVSRCKPAFINDRGCSQTCGFVRRRTLAATFGFLSCIAPRHRLVYLLGSRTAVCADI